MSSPILPRASTSAPTGRPLQNRKQPLVASVLSDGAVTSAGYVTPPPYPIAPQMFESPRPFSSHTSKGGSASGPSSSIVRRGPAIPRDDFGISHMMAIIEYQAVQAMNKESVAVERTGKEKKRGVVDERLLGRRVDPEWLHPQMGDIFKDGFKMLRWYWIAARSLQ